MVTAYYEGILKKILVRRKMEKSLNYISVVQGNKIK